MSFQELDTEVQENREVDDVIIPPNLDSLSDENRDDVQVLFFRIYYVYCSLYANTLLRLVYSK